jgi:hypothetical protein
VRVTRSSERFDQPFDRARGRDRDRDARARLRAADHQRDEREQPVSGDDATEIVDEANDSPS